MNAVAALALALDGIKVRRRAWLREAPKLGEAEIDKRVTKEAGLLSFEGETFVYGRTRSFGRRLYLGSDDLTATDWEVALPAEDAKGCEPGSQAMRDYPALCDELRETGPA